MNTLEKIKYLRLIHNKTQKEVAEAIGLNKSNYCNYENGKWRFTIDHINKLAKYYHVSIAYLVDQEETDIVITEQDLNVLIKAKEVIQKIENSFNIKNKK